MAFKLKLRNKLILSILGVILLFGFLATYFVYLYSFNLLSENEVVDLEILAEEKANSAVNLFGLVGDVAAKIAEDDCVVECLLPDEAEEEFEPESNLYDVLEGYNIGDHFSAIYVMDLEGEVQGSTDPSFVGKNYNFRDYFQQALTGESYLDVAVGVTSGALGYYYSHPIEDEGEVIGVVVVKMRPEVVSEIVQLYVEDSIRGEKFIFVDEFGVVLYSSDESKIFKTLGQLDDAVLAEIAELRRYDGLDLEPLEYDVVLHGLSGVQSSEAFYLMDEYDDEEKVLVIAKTGEYPFYLIIEQELERFEELALRAAQLLALFVFLAAIFAATSIAWAVLRFLKPVNEINAFAKKLAKGDYSHRILVNSGDEMQDLAETLNNMAKHIEKSSIEIEKKVEERTSELEGLTKHMVDRELKMVELKKKINKDSEDA